MRRATEMIRKAGTAACLRPSGLLYAPMTDPERINALLDLAERAGKNGFRPSTAGWSLLGEQGRRFRPM